MWVGPKPLPHVHLGRLASMHGQGATCNYGVGVCQWLHCGLPRDCRLYASEAPLTAEAQTGDPTCPTWVDLQARKVDVGRWRC